MVKPKEKVTVPVVPLSDDVVMASLACAYRSFKFASSIGISDSFEKIALEYLKRCCVKFVMLKPDYDRITKGD